MEAKGGFHMRKRKSTPDLGFSFCFRSFFLIKGCAHVFH